MDVEEEAGWGVQRLPESLLQTILRRCELGDVGRSACVDRRWRSIVSDDALWKDLCHKHFELSSPSDHLGNLYPSYQEAYKIWYASFHKYPLSLVVRAKKCWDFLKLWASSNFPEVADSLRAGVSEEDLDKVEETVGWKLPLPVRVLYRFCGGQDTTQEFFDEDESDEDEACNRHYVGLLGGYSFYNHMVNVHFLSLQKVLLLTQYFIPQWGALEAARKWIVIAASFPLEKFFLLDCHDGSLHVGTRHLATHGELMSCVPPSLEAANMQDSMLCWLEEYCTRLNLGMYSVQKFDGASSISLYPEQEPLCTEAVSYGVQVRSSAVFVPEYSTLQVDHDHENYMFAYFVRMRLLPSGNGLHANPFISCQLSKRHWIIRENGIVKDEVRGPAVIGQYPLLETGGKTFMYASCTPLGVSNGSIHGDFKFVPGSLKHPEGPEFLVRVAQFGLEVPKFIF